MSNNVYEKVSEQDEVLAVEQHQNQVLVVETFDKKQDLAETRQWPQRIITILARFQDYEVVGDDKVIID